MVYLHLYPCIVSLLGVMNLLAYESQQFRFHLVGRDEQFAELNRLEWFIDKLKHLFHLPHYLWPCRHHHIVGINLCVALVQVSCSYTCDVAFLTCDINQFGVNLQSFHTEHHFHSRLLKSFAPFDVAFLVESCEQFDNHGHLFPVACRTD